ncbi:putative phiE125 gp8 family phage protein [Pseudaminobacter salicylatoxidans]|uniref:Putative phiE125 gp8 family phage protein n=1 Tax=Pseudaminobacter salicylatoxidans TaxID=93369 RepID=A0A316BL75_PSESE|nr:head-tail connector protein [Pseudaminobacter salicylatoxidans]PWJ73833.1 putative phiE125 gp8 family phage protein [Pseudaminobacter salicylatoxidans]
MWHPSTVIGAPDAEPVTLADARGQCGILPGETHFDTQLNRLIKAARAHAEEYCNARWAGQTISSQCDSFADFSRLSEGPLKSVTSIEYVDADGNEQTVDATVYEEHKDGLEPSIALKPGQSWPRVRFGSRITLTAVYGGSVPESVQHAMLMLIGHWFVNRDAVVTGTIATTIPMGVDALLSNHRRGA